MRGERPVALRRLRVHVHAAPRVGHRGAIPDSVVDAGPVVHPKQFGVASPKTGLQGRRGARDVRGGEAHEPRDNRRACKDDVRVVAGSDFDASGRGAPLRVCVRVFGREDVLGDPAVVSSLFAF